MKNLLKNATKSFLQSKIAMILLAFIVFISSATFTMLNSSSVSFQTSYQKVMNEGNVHDFTIKEKWKVNGTIDLSIQEDKTSNIFRPQLDSNTKIENDFTNANKKLFYPNTDLSWFDFQNAKTQKPSFKLDLSNAIINYDAQGIFKLKGDIKMSILFPFGGIKSETNGLKNSGAWSTEFILNSSTQKNNPFSIKDSFGFNKQLVTLKKSGSEIIEDIEALISKEFIRKKFHKYILDASKSTGAFNDKNINWSSLFSKLTTSEYPFISDKDKADFEIQPFILKEIKTIEAKMTNVIENKMSETFLNSVKTHKLKNHKNISDYIYEPSIVKSLFVSAEQNQFKVVSSRFDNNHVDKTVIFSGKKPGMGYTEAEMKKGLDSFWKKEIAKKPLLKTATPSFDKEKKFHWIKQIKNQLGILLSIGFTNFDSLQAVVSSSYVYEHNLNTMSQEDLEYFRNQYLNGTPKKTLFKKFKSENKVVTIDSTDYLISGIGTSPDFSFPIINHKNPLPNAKTQAIIFTTKLGFERIKDAFRNNEKEDYLAFKFKYSTPESIKQEILKTIETSAKSKMTWPKSISPLTLRDDIKERVILAPQRISFLGNIQKSIATISYLTTSMLCLLTLFIISMVIKKQINAKRKILSILLANGYTKNKIAISMMSIAFIIITIPAMLGYVGGYFLQLLFISIFNNYWTLPIVFNSFSFITMSIVIALPMLITMVVAYISTRAELKGNLLSIMKESSSKTGGWITTKINSKLNFIKAKGKITISLFTSNLSKMLMVCLTSTMAIIAASTAFSILGKFDYAKTKSAAPIGYSFKVDLETPTTSNNTYSISDLKNYGLANGKEWDKTLETNDMFQPHANTNGTTRPYFHWIEDPLKEKAESEQLDYLKHKIQIRPLLDMEIGLAPFTVNPWLIAKSSMPDNQLNQSRNQDESFLTSSYEAISNYQKLEWFNKLTMAEKSNVSQKLDAVKKSKWFPEMKNHTLVGTASNGVIDPKFKDFLFFSIKTQIIRRIHKKENHLPFMISYGNIVKEKEDETYSQLSFNYSDASNNSIVSSKIIGIQPNTKMIHLNKDNLKALNSFKMNDINIVDNKNDEIPIIINSYFQEAYKVKVGQSINIEINNHKEKNDLTKKHTTNAKIVGVEETYNGIKIYSLQKFINNKLGFQQSDNIINGIFTKEVNDPLVFKGVNLYSESDFYIGAASVEKEDKIWTEMEKVIQDPTKWFNKSVTDFSSYISSYSSTPYVLSMSNANWAAMSAYAFSNTLDLTNKMIWIIEIIAILIALFFISIIALMVVDNNKIFIATTKVLGYTKREIKSMFFRSLALPLLLAAIIAAPITYVALIGIKYIIMSFGSILVPVSIIWWSIPTALLILIVLFSIIYRIAMNKFGNKQMLEAFKV